MSDRLLRSVLSVLVLCAAAPLFAEDVDAGIDLWKTLPEFDTKAELSLPAGFFNPSSDALNVTVDLKGATLMTKSGTPTLGNADTVIERLEDAHPVTCGNFDTVPLRIAALHLVGECPLIVTYGGGSAERWTVDVYLSDAAQALGEIKIFQNCPDGGKFDSMVKVRPKFIFTRTSDHLQRILDWEEYPSVAQEITFTSESSDWARRGPDGFSLTTVEAGAIVDANHDGDWEDTSPLPGTTSDFVVGARVEACSCAQSVQAARLGRTAGSAGVYPSQTFEEELLASHIIDPPTFFAVSFPLSRDKARAAKAQGGEPEEQEGGDSAALQALPLISLGLLALVLAVIPWWLRRK